VKLALLEMSKKDERDMSRVEAVLELLRKQTPLTVKQVLLLHPLLSTSTHCSFCRYTTL